MITFDDLFDWLIAIQKHHHDQADRRLPVVRIPRAEPGFDWTGLPQKHRTDMPSVDHGQLADNRYPAPADTGVHELVYEDHSDFHLDVYDGCRFPLHHVASDTNLAPGVIAGSIIGAIFGGGIGAVVGAGIGGWLTGTEPRETLIYPFERLQQR